MDQANTLRERIRAKTQTVFIDRKFENDEKTARVIAVTSGKGGVGKSNVALNLAINLKKQGKKVILFDADIGLSNLDILSGVKMKYNLFHVLNEGRDISEIIEKGPLDIPMISGGNGILELNNISESQMFYIIKNFSRIDWDYDFVIIDTGAGISNVITNIVKASHEVIIVTTPEPTSITDSYSVIKAISVGDTKIPSVKMIINKAENEKEGFETYENLKLVSNKFLSLDLEYLGSLPDDKNLVKAVKKQEAVCELYPNTDFSKKLKKISAHLSDSESTEKSDGGFLNYFKKLVNVFDSKGA